MTSVVTVSSVVAPAWLDPTETQKPPPPFEDTASRRCWAEAPEMRMSLAFSVEAFAIVAETLGAESTYEFDAATLTKPPPSPEEAADGTPLPTVPSSACEPPTPSIICVPAPGRRL